jgi:cobaltochelatase CobS
MQERSFKVAKAAEVFNISAPDSVTVKVYDQRTPFVPEIDAAYEFKRDQLKNVLLCLEGDVAKNLLVQGPTGCGKSSLIEQVCARLNIEVWRIACHSKLEFAEMLGSMTLVPGAMKAQDGLLTKAGAALKSIFKGAEDGETLLEWVSRSLSSGVVTRFQDGPAVTAARRGGVLLMDEGNFLPPSTFGAFNTLLDGGSLLVPETGEIVAPHPQMRVAMTGNAVNDDDTTVYRGIQRMSVALMHRFLTMRVDYMSQTQEAQILAKTVPGLSGQLMEAMLAVANETRAAFKGAVIETTISTRIMVRWATLIHKRKGAWGGPKQTEAITEALRFALLDGANPTDAKAIQAILEKTVHGKDFGPKPAAPAPQSGASAAPAVPSSAGTAAQQVAPQAAGNPSRALVTQLLAHHNNGAPKIWAVVEQVEYSPSTAIGNGGKASLGHEVWFGSFGKGLTPRTVDSRYFASKSPEKLAKGYVDIGTLEFRPGVTEAANLVDFLYRVNMLRMGSAVALSPAEQHVARQLWQAMLLKSPPF